MSTPEQASEVALLQQVLEALTPLNQDVRNRIIHTVCTFFDIPGGTSPEPRNFGGQFAPFQHGPHLTQFSDRPSLSPKQFLLEKEPKTDVERVACLAFYLTHYHDTPHFKTLDISKLNTEAAQAKFSNAANAVDNATKLGYLVPATKGNKQLSAIGEQFVQALPDREKAKLALERRKPRRAGKVRRPESE